MFEAFGLSDPGCVRTNNEDYFISDSRSGIFIVADGMGGANAGEYASRLSAETLYGYLLAGAADNSLNTLENGFAQANTVVRQASQESPEFDGMGTTLVAVRAVDDFHLQLANVGDSRAYSLSGGEFSILTTDHTWVSEVGSRLGLSDEALRKHPMRHLLTMAIGVADEVRLNSHVVSVFSGDQILLCSDGLHGVVDEKILHEALNSEKSLPDKAHYLIEAAKEQGGPDNVTVVLIQIH
ncbi:MAG TPA: protein phosphatase 2C domain-containing protein [Bryobacteraceae bacterium]|jgi:protein phosphatase|nr:protein phosphatase 2C domain-containing protein [Bryobacteraceae bacterium]